MGVSDFVAQCANSPCMTGSEIVALVGSVGFVLTMGVVVLALLHRMTRGSTSEPDVEAKLAIEEAKVEAERRDWGG